MKVLTLHQPWASLVALGVKRIETRSWSTRYRGPIAIHAGLVWPKMMHLPELKRGRPVTEEQEKHNHQTWSVVTTIVDPAYHGPIECNPKTGRQKRIPKSAQAPTLFWPHAGPWYRQGKPVENPYTGQAPYYPHTEPLPLGQIVAVADLTDVVPITDRSAFGTRTVVQIDAPLPGGGTTRQLWDDDGRSCVAINDQLPFGDFAEGRWAWMLDNVRPLPSPVSWRGAQGLRDLPADVAECLTATVAALDS